MNIENRINRIEQFCYNPYIELDGLTSFEKLYINSMRDYGRDMSVIDSTSFPSLNNMIMSFKSIKESGKQNLLLWTGGKESFLTSKILEFFDVPYKKVTFLEEQSNGEDFSGGKKSFIDEGFLKPDIVLNSDIVDRLATNSWGASVPVLYYYVLRMLEEHPGSIIWIGSEYMSSITQYRLKFTLDQSDIMFSDINMDLDISGEVYSCVNSLREFDIYRIVRKEFKYNPEFSFYDQGDRKKERIGIWEKYMTLLDTIDNSAEKDLIYMELNYIPMGISLYNPVCYDWRNDIAKFLRTLSSFDRYR